LVLLGLLFVLTLGAVAMWRLILAPPALPPGIIAVSGRIEGDDAAVAAKLAGRIREISAHEFLLGKILADLTVGLVQWGLALALMFTLFGLRFAGDPTPLLVASVLFLFCAVSFGALVGSAIPNQAAAVQAVGLGGFLLAFLLSGLIFPVENIPTVLRWISNLVQARYFIVVVRDAFLQGGGWPAVWWAVLAIGGIGLAFYGLAWRTMRRMQVTA
jgi:ABC-2 type transport system permease protein